MAENNLRITIMIDRTLADKLREKQAKYIIKNHANISLSKIINEILFNQLAKKGS